MDVVKVQVGSRDMEVSSKYDSGIKSHSMSEDESLTDEESNFSENEESEADSDSDLSGSSGEEYEESDIFSSDEEDDDDEEPSPFLLSQIFGAPAGNHDACNLIGDNACGVTMCAADNEKGSTLLKESHGTPYSTALYRNRRRAQKQSDRYLKRFCRRMQNNKGDAIKEVATISESNDVKAVAQQKEKILSPASSTVTPKSLKQRLQNLVTDRRNKRNEIKNKKKSKDGQQWKKTPKRSSEHKKITSPLSTKSLQAHSSKLSPTKPSASTRPSTRTLGVPASSAKQSSAKQSSVKQSSVKQSSVKQSSVAQSSTVPSRANQLKAAQTTAAAQSSQAISKSKTVPQMENTEQPTTQASTPAETKSSRPTSDTTQTPSPTQTSSQTQSTTGSSDPIQPQSNETPATGA
jgi:hypothetical protein